MDEISFNPADPNDLFELVELLGEGSYGAVYKATHKADPSRPPVAVKIIPADEDLSSLKREIHILKRCRCAYVVEFIDCFFLDNELWIVMEFCLGGSVSDMLDATETTLTEPQIRSICACVALGLAYLHEQHNIHRDLKAGNILLSMDGKAKLADFGVSAQLNNTLSKRKTVIGTPFWMAPEVIQESSYDGKADVWSLGITAIEMAEGMPPHFNVHPMRAIFLIPSKPAPRLTDPAKWSNDFNDFVKVCLNKDPAKRIDSAGLLSHPFIKADVELLRSSPGVGLDPIKDLLTSSLQQLADYRREDSKGGSGDDGQPDADATLRAADPAMAGTLVQRRGTAGGRPDHQPNRSPKATATGAPDGGGALRHHNRRASPSEGENDTGTMVRGIRGSPNRGAAGAAGVGGHRRGASSDDHTGTLVRHRPASRRNSKDDAAPDGTVEATGTTNFTGTSNKMEQNPGLQSALRYFQSRANSSGSSSADTVAAGGGGQAADTTLRKGGNKQPPSPRQIDVLTEEDEKSTWKTAVSGGDTARSAMVISTADVSLDMSTSAPTSYHERKLRELKSSTAQEIQEQLKALELQYREDLEALHKAYQSRKKELEEALHYC